MKNIYFYKVFNKSELKNISTLLEEQVNSWLKAWFSMASAKVEVVNAIDERDLVCDDKYSLENIVVNNTRYGFSNNEDVVIDIDGIYLLLSKLLSGSEELEGEDACAGIRHMGSQCANELNDLIRLQTRRVAKSSVAWRGADDYQSVGSGWVVADLNCDGIHVFVFISGHIASALITKDFKAHEIIKNTLLRQLVSDKKVDMVARLGDVKLNLGDFRSLQPGNVLVLSKSIKDGVDLYTSAGEYLCESHLGKQSLYKAIKIKSNRNLG